MALQGTLDTFSLPDVLRLLATTSKTGRLRLEGDRGQGSVWLQEGKVVDTAADHAVDGTPTEERIFELLRFESGSFAFDSDDRATAPGRPEEVEDLLTKASTLLGEWSELEAVVPSLAHHVSLASDLSADEVTIDADRWRSVVAVASGRTVGELARALELSELGVSRAVRDLVELGVADVGEPESASEPLRRPQREPRRRAPLAPPEPLSSDGQRAGWLAADRTGEIPAVAPKPRSAPAGGSASHDDRPARRGPATGLPSRAGRTAGPTNGAGPAPEAPPSPSLRTNDPGRATPARPPETGRIPAVRPGAGDPPVPPLPPRGADDTGRGATARPADPGRAPMPGPGRPGGPAGPGGIGPGGRRDAGAPPRRPSRPGPAAGRPGDGPPFDTGRFGATPPPHDTGQIRPVPPSALPPDLHWAADDVTSTGPISSPFSGLTSLGPSRPAANDGEVAAHVAAMSPEARSAVQSAVGNSGGSTPGRGPAHGEDVAQRSRLISFLSTVR